LTLTIGIARLRLGFRTSWLFRRISATFVQAGLLSSTTKPIVETEDQGGIVSAREMAKKL
jgi:hypothetical protein